MPNWIEPLDLQSWLVSVFAGTMEIFIFISLIAIAGLAAKYRMLNSTLLIMYGLFGIIMAQFYGGIYFLVILIGGLMTAFALSKLVKS